MLKSFHKIADWDMITDDNLRLAGESWTHY